MPKKKILVEEPEVKPEDEPEVEVEPKVKPILRKKQAPPTPPSPVENECSDEEDESTLVEERKIRGRPKKSTVQKQKRAPSLWMQCLQEHGYMVKGGSFKPTPKKGSPEYTKIRAVFDQRKQSQ